MTVLVIFSGIFVVGLLLFLSSIFNGYVLSVLWGWFVVPTFGVPKLSVTAAIGIALVVSYITDRKDSNEKEDKRPFGEILREGLTEAIAKSLFVLFFGWIVHLFM